MRSRTWMDLHRSCRSGACWKGAAKREEDREGAIWSVELVGLGTWSLTPNVRRARYAHMNARAQARRGRGSGLQCWGQQVGRGVTE